MLNKSLYTAYSRYKGKWLMHGQGTLIHDSWFISSDFRLMYPEPCSRSPECCEIGYLSWATESLAISQCMHVVPSTLSQGPTSWTSKEQLIEIHFTRAFVKCISISCDLCASSTKYLEKIPRRFRKNSKQVLNFKTLVVVLKHDQS